MSTKIISTCCENSVELKITMNQPLRLMPYWAIAMKSNDRVKFYPVQKIMQECCTYYGISGDRIKSPTREAEVAKVRHVICYLARRLERHGTPHIGRQINRDHSTVHHAVVKINNQLFEDRFLREEVEAICRILNVNPARAMPRRHDITSRNQ